MNLRKVMTLKPVYTGSAVTGTQEAGEGWFHKFMSDPDGEAVAVVEMEDGSVATFFVNRIRFLTRPQ